MPSPDCVHGTRESTSSSFAIVRVAVVAVLLAAGVELVARTEASAQARSPAPAFEPFALEVSAPDPDDAVTLPPTRGPRAVGTRTYHWVLDRPEELTPAPSDRREVIAQLFYPAADGQSGRPAAYVPELPLMRRGLLVHGFPPFAALSERMAAYERVLPGLRAEAKILGGSPFPVVLISPGGNMSRHWHTALARELASHGYVVAALSHAHSGMDVFPGGGFLASHLRWHPGDDVPSVEVDERDRELAIRLAEDVKAVVTGLAEMNGTGPLADRLDLDRLALIGHSRGGSTVTAACGGDSAFGACVVLDNLGAVAGFDPAVRQPRLVLRTVWPDDRVRRLGARLAKAETDAFDVVLRGAGHHSFTDLVLVDPERYPSEGMGAREAHRLVSGLTLAFLDRYLRGDAPAFPVAVESLAGDVELTVH
ncbi:MAG: hypothetical protein R3266_08485 [Gemmatimonadota bacterium]|nr:hypothetical protein [Gemmatimonadota bacterium]